MLVSLFLELLYVVTYNLILVLFGFIAVLRARKGKKPWGFMIAGILIQGISIFGMIAGMVRNPELWNSYENMISLAAYIIFALVFVLLIRKFQRKHNP